VGADVHRGWYHSHMPEPTQSLNAGALGVPRYAVLLGARLDPSWSSWFNGLRLEPMTDGRTLLVGPVRDQAALHGLLACIRDLGIELLGLSRVDDA
jgi:hypothetical protein